ncbi:ADP-ribosylglycohydrolase family protein [Pilimelia columellifera]|uniref:ADP-ribosylglycohydrolase family protein n=1 Tax=Pilimelia columellifera subsp. columellifera TaxID=706583 RepID=A0ABP6AS29_9ACTN
MRRVAGSLFGLAYGDAIGGPVEFCAFEEIVRRHGPDGPRELPGDPAPVTDDTQLALAVGWALYDADGPTAELLEPHLRERFVAWLVSPDNDRAPGLTCLHACEGLQAGRPWQEATIVGAKGCGANMRATPIGLVPDIDEELVAAMAQFQAAMTHAHPTALAAAELTALAVWLLRDDHPVDRLPAMLRERCDSQRQVYRQDWLGGLWERAGAASAVDFIAHGWDECAGALDRLTDALGKPDDGGDACLATGAGWVAEEALATALYCALRHADDPVSALARAARTSGDSDSVASLAGAFQGAAHGMGAWPPQWAERIEYADQLRRLSQAWEPA